MEGRFFYQVGIVYFVATLLASAFAGTASATLGVLLVLLFPSVYYLVDEKWRKKCQIVIVTMILAVNLFNVRYFLSFLPARNFANKTVQLEGIVLDLAGAESDPMYLVKADVIADDGLTGHNLKLLVYQGREARFELFDRVSGQVRLYIPKPKDGFNLEKYNRAKGIFLCAKPIDADLKVKAPRHKLLDYLKLSNRRISSNISMALSGDQGDVMRGLLLGDRAYLSEDMKTIFRHAGIYHILVVSGLHMNVLTQLIFWMLKRLKVGLKKSAAISILACLSFVAVIGPSPSVVRCAVMTIIYLLGRIFGQESDARNSLGLSLALLLVFNPYSAWDLGLQLSFLSTWGIIVFSGSVIEIWRCSFGKCGKLAEAFCVSISASLVTLPVIMINFDEYPILAPISNTVIAPIIPVAFMSSMFCGILKPIFRDGLVYQLLASFAGLVITLIMGVARVFSSFKFLTVSLKEGYVLVSLLFVLLSTLVIIVYLRRIPAKEQQVPKLVKLVLAIFVALLFVGGTHHEILRRKTAEIFVLPGKGSVLISCGGRNVLLGEASTEAAVHQIDKCLDLTRNEKIDILVNASGERMERICANFQVLKILSTKANDIILVDDADIEVMELSKTKEVKIGSGILRLAKFKSGLIATFEYGGILTVIAEPDIEESKFSPVVSDASNIIMSKNTKLRARLISGRNIIIYDQQIPPATKKILMVDASGMTEVGSIIRLKISEAGTKILVTD